MITLAILMIAWPPALILGILIWGACRGNDECQIWLTIFGIIAAVASIVGGFCLLDQVIQCVPS